MSHSPQVLEYSKAQGSSIRLSDDRTAFDAEIEPSTAPLRTQMIVGAILGFAPFAVLYFYSRHAPYALLLIIAATVFFLVFGGVIYALALATKVNTRIHADRQHLSMDRYTTSIHFSRRWQRDEIQRVHAKWLGYDGEARWGVVIDLPLVQSRVVEGLAEDEARLIAEGVRTALDLPQNDTPFEFKAPAFPTDLWDIDIPRRHGVIVDRSPHRLTIIVPAGGVLGVWRESPEALIELDHYMLYVDCADPVKKQEKHRHRRSWPRGEITSIKGDLHAMGLTIRIAGVEMYELLKQSPQELRIWVARTLNDELARLPEVRAVSESSRS